MASEWYIQHNGKQYGPLTSAKLKQLAAERKITPTTSVRAGAQGNWVPASKVQGLFAQQPAAADSAPKSPPATSTQRASAPHPLEAALPPAAPPMASPLARLPIGAPIAKPVELQPSIAATIIGAIGLVFGILALATCWLPILPGPLGWIGIVVGVSGLILGAAGLTLAAMHRGVGLYLNIAGTSSAAVGLVLTVVLGVTFGLFAHKPAPEIVYRPPQPVLKPVAPPPDLPKEAAPPPIVWTDAAQPIEQPPIRARIAGAAIENIRLESSDLTSMKRGPTKPMLRLRVTIENTSADRIVEVAGWSGGGGLLSGANADFVGAAANLLAQTDAAKAIKVATAGTRLVDNVGNDFKQVPSFQVVGAKITASEDPALRPAESREFELVFQQPLPTIEFLRLELDAGGFAGNEPLRFQIPKAMIAGL